jgi:hypothetical protein
LTHIETRAKEAEKETPIRGTPTKKATKKKRKGKNRTDD